MILRRIPITSLGLVAAAAAAAAIAAGHRQEPRHMPAEMIASVSHRVTLKGVPVTGLYPRAVRPLRIKVTNPYSFSIKLPKITAKMSKTTNRAGCTGSAANIVVTTRGMRPLVIPRKASRYATISVTMPPTVANACQGATFKIAFTARAVKA